MSIEGKLIINYEIDEEGKVDLSLVNPSELDFVRILGLLQSVQHLVTHNSFKMGDPLLFDGPTDRYFGEDCDYQFTEGYKCMSKKKGHKVHFFNRPEEDISLHANAES